ncbi:hypothetical protein Bca52824_087991 [Brassica carinata]|uniref:Uncharacterized protein n=1 Tax=Brassica carinata TaxID=52824 RepID=A0A8X7PDC5_BRACI|nr:hypothetical protein Bca52824_087991 [Brassica carinata]
MISQRFVMYTRVRTVVTISESVHKPRGWDGRLGLYDGAVTEYEQIGSARNASMCPIMMVMLSDRLCEWMWNVIPPLWLGSSLNVRTAMDGRRRTGSIGGRGADRTD